MSKTYRHPKTDDRQARRAVSALSATKTLRRLRGTDYVTDARGENPRSVATREALAI